VDVPTASVVIAGAGFCLGLLWHVMSDIRERRSKDANLRKFRKALRKVQDEVRNHRCAQGDK
jgi:hypothetical protein